MSHPSLSKASPPLVPATEMRSLVQQLEHPARLIVDETRLDLDSPCPFQITPWHPTTTVVPYEQVSKLYLDIETLGLDPMVDRIIAIGLRDERQISYKITHQDEGWILRQALAAIAKKQPKLLLGYNHLAFDLPFIIERCRIHQIPHPFTISNREKRIGAARINGKAIRFHPIYAKGMDLVDVYHQVLINDFSARHLTRYTLKQAALQMGVRDIPRLDLSYPDICNLWAKGQTEPILEYLEYDLEDTERLADYLVPSIYYQQEFIPGMSVQALAVNGNGTKWQRILEDQYPDQLAPATDDVVEFEGGLTLGVAGLHRNVSKVDVSSLYPSIMLRYGIYSRKDPEGKMLSILASRLTERLRLKALAKQGDRAAHQKQQASKIMINSLYGFLGTPGVGYNDYEAAALVTAYGRAIARLMITTIEQAGGTVAEVDTDGVLFRAPPGENEHIFQAVQAALPEGINVEHEFQAEAAFIPAAQDGIKGLSKNYLVFFADGRVKSAGRFRNRDRSELERTYQANYIQLFLTAPEMAESHHQETLEQLRSGNYPTSKLSVTRKIRRGEKALLTLGNEGDIVTFYEGPNEVKVSSGLYNSRYYSTLIEEMRAGVLKVTDPELLSTTQPTQLKLL